MNSALKKFGLTGACLAVDGGMTAMLRPNPVMLGSLTDHEGSK